MSRIGILMGGFLAIISYYQDWIVVHMPPGEYSGLAGSKLEVAPSPSDGSRWEVQIWGFGALSS